MRAPSVLPPATYWVWRHPQGDLVLVFSHWHTLIGVVPDDTRLQLGIEAGPVAAWQHPFRLSEDAENHDALALD